MTTKRMAALFVALALVSALSGCAGSSAPAASTPTAVDATQAPAANAAAPAAASSTAAADFYKGKTVSIYVGSNAGVFVDLTIRTIVPYLEELTGATFVVQNESGGGGRVILNQMYSQKENDGLSLLFMQTGSIWPAYMMGDTAVQVDITRFQYVGGIETGNLLMMVSANGKYKTIDDLTQADGLKFSASNRTTLPTMGNALAAELLGLKNAAIITGFDSSSGRVLAVQQGEVDGVVLSPSSAAKQMQDGVLTPVLQIGKERMATFKDVPSLADVRDFATLTETQQQLVDTMGIFYDASALIAPPGTAQDKVDFLGNALQQAYNNPQLIAELEKVFGTAVEQYVSGAEISEKATELSAKKAAMSVWEDILNKYAQ